MFMVEMYVFNRVLRNTLGPSNADPSLAGQNLNIVCAHIAPAHIAVFVELPMFIAMSSEPLSRPTRLPLVFEANRNAIV